MKLPRFLIKKKNHNSENILFEKNDCELLTLL